MSAVFASLITASLGVYLSFGAAVLTAAVGAWWLARHHLSTVDALTTWATYQDGQPPRLQDSVEWTVLSERLGEAFGQAIERAEKAELELAHLRTVMETMADGVIVADANSRVRMANHAAQKLFSRYNHQAIGSTVIEYTLNADLDRAVQEAIAAGGVVSADIEVTYPQTKHLSATVTASGGGAERAAVAVLHDNTESVRIANVRKDFVANVSHELRTPVTGIQTMAENLLHGAVDDPSVSRHFLTHILDAAHRLVVLVDDLLFLARAESRPAATTERVSVAAVANRVVCDLEHLAEKRHIDISTRIPDELSVPGNDEDIQHILTNLVDNAVKYTLEGGSIGITAESNESDVFIRVKDDGPGIAPEHQDRIFERFYRVDLGRSREMGGTGLGLSIVKHLAERMGGSVHVVSEPGKGSEFIVCLPKPPG